MGAVIIRFLPHSTRPPPTQRVAMGFLAHFWPKMRCFFRRDPPYDLTALPTVGAVDFQVPGYFEKRCVASAWEKIRPANFAQVWC